jgi:hypothetical protein
MREREEKLREEYELKTAGLLKRHEEELKKKYDEAIVNRELELKKMFERELATAVNTKMDELKSKLEVDAKRREDELRREVNHQLDALRTERAELERERKKLHAELEKKLVQAKLEREARGQIERELMAIEEDIERLRADQQELEDAIRNRVLRPKVIIEK